MIRRALLIAVVCLPLLAAPASAQVLVQTYSPVITSFDTLTNTPVSTYRTAVTMPPAGGCCQPALAAPVTTYSPVVNYSPVLASTPMATTSYYTPPAATVTTYSPITAAVTAPVTTYMPMTSYTPVTTYSPVTTYYAPAAVTTYSPVVYTRPYFVPGEPVRNLFRAILY